MRLRRKRKGAPERELSLEEFIPMSDGEFRLQIPIEGLTPEQALEQGIARGARSRHQQAAQEVPDRAGAA